MNFTKKINIENAREILENNMTEKEKNTQLNLKLQNLRNEYLNDCIKQDKKEEKMKKNKIYNKIKKKLMSTGKIIKFVKTDENAITPTLGTKGAAAFDLYSPRMHIIPSKQRYSIDIGLKMELPENMCGVIKTRSSMALKGITVEGGLIDNDYRGKISVILSNIGNEDYIIQEGDRIAQIKLEKYYNKYVFLEVDSLSNTIRNEGGFGSTGV